MQLKLETLDRSTHFELLPTLAPYRSPSSEPLWTLQPNFTLLAQDSEGNQKLKRERPRVVLAWPVGPCARAAATGHGAAQVAARTAAAPQKRSYRSRTAAPILDPKSSMER